MLTLDSRSNKKPYVSIQVARLGQFTELTKAAFFGRYKDGGSGPRSNSVTKVVP